MEERGTTLPLLVSAVVLIGFLIVGGVIDARLSPGDRVSRTSLPEQSTTDSPEVERSTPEVVTTEIADQNDPADGGSTTALEEDDEAEDPACIGAEGQIADLKAQATDLREEAEEIRLQADVVASEDGGLSSAAMLRDTAREYTAMASDLEAEANELQRNCP